MSDPIKVAHALHLVSRLGTMKDQEVVCDFTIKVGNKSYPVHKAVLVAMSEYFEGLFSSNMREVQQGFIEMKDIEAIAFEKGLEFMYTGSTKITMDSVTDILHVAELFQLGSLKTLCFQFLTNHLSGNNCLSVIHLATTYNRPDVKQAAEKVVVSDFKTVISSETFPLISRSDFLRYISKADHQAKWKALVTWAADKKELPELLEAIGLEHFPFQLLLDTALKEPLVQKSVTARIMVVRQLFSNPVELEKNLSASNCISLKLLARKYKLRDGMQDMINRSMEESFGKILTQPSFCEITRGDILSLFRSQSTRYSSEMLKWNAALNWVKHDINERKKVFPRLFRLIKLENFPVDFLKEIIRNEQLVKESKQCSDVLMDAVFGKASSAMLKNTSCLVPSSEHGRRVRVEKVIGKEGGGPGCLCEPWGICSTPEGNIIVADAGNHRIQILDLAGHSIRIFGREGSGPGEFLYPSDVSMSSSGEIAVADHHNHRIQIFDVNGQFIREFGKHGHGKLNHPWSVSIDSKGYVYVGACEYGVFVYSSKGAFIEKFGKEAFPSTSGGEVYVAAAEDDKIVVTLGYTGFVWIFDRRRKLVYDYRCNSSDYERGLARDKKGLIFMGSTEGFIRVLDPAEDHEWSFGFGGVKGSEPGEMSMPRGVAVLPDGRIAVSDSGNHRIQVFSLH